MVNTVLRSFLALVIANLREILTSSEGHRLIEVKQLSFENEEWIQRHDSTAQCTLPLASNLSLKPPEHCRFFRSDPVTKTE
jgi:hypothetical protein